MSIWFSYENLFWADPYKQQILLIFFSGFVDSRLGFASDEQDYYKSQRKIILQKYIHNVLYGKSLQRKYIQWFLAAA